MKLMRFRSEGRILLSVSVLVLTAMGLTVTAQASTSPSSAASAGKRATVTVERLTAQALATMIPHSEFSTCLAALFSPRLTASTRLDWCAAFANTLVVTENNKPVGTATINQVDYASWKVSSRTWNPVEQTFSEVSSSGVLKGEPIAVDGASACNSGCRVTSNFGYTLAVPVDPAFGQRNVGVDSPGSATVTGQLTTVWVYTALGLATTTAPMTTVGVRCDSQPGYRYPAGCANPSYTPTYVLSSSRYPDIAKFDKAELAKHPNWSTLTRVSPAQTRANRRVACRGFRRRSSTDSCDEFPYASTAQGGRGAAQEHVNLSQNQAQGGNLLGFYNANRLHYGEKFHVKVS